MKIPDKKPYHKPGNSNPNKLLAKRLKNTARKGTGKRRLIRNDSSDVEVL